MALREYTDHRGTDWTVWSVPPRYSSARSGVERRQRPTPNYQPERRVLPERRRRSLDPILLQGWLCFDAEAERRRLTPIPADWSECDLDTLSRYCAQAQPVRRSLARASPA